MVDKDDWRVNPSVFRLVDAKWGPHTIDRRVFLPIVTLSFRVLTPSLLFRVAAVLMPWYRIGVERMTGFALRWVSSWTPFEFSRLVPVVGLDYS